MSSRDEGWAWPPNCRKAHYFINNRSLCGKWSFFGRKMLDNGKDSSNDCKACSRKIKKLREARKPVS